jgi:hypothetical protein
MNSQLVKGAGDAADKFVDLAGAVNAGVGPGINHEAIAAQRKAQARADEAKVEGYMNRIPADFDVSQIPQKYRENISNFLTKGKQQYADAAMAIGDYEVGSDGYIAHVATMNKVKNSFHNLKSQFDQFGAGKKDLTQDMLEGMYSKGNDPNEISLLTSVYTDELDVNIGEDGNIGFIGGDGNITNLGDLPDYFNKDYKNGDAIQNMANSIYKAGNPLNSSTSLMYENKLYSMIEKGGLSTLKSLARDDFFNRGGIPSITDEELNDPMQRDAVEKKLVDYYMGVFKTHASNGASARKSSVSSGSSDKNNKTAAGRKADIKMKNISSVWDENVTVDSDFSMLNRFLPANMKIQKYEDNRIVITKGENIEMDLNPSDPSSIYDIYRFAGIDSSYWPDIETKKDDPLNPDS